MLTTQLGELEADGIVRRTIYAEVPPRVEYALTEYAATLEQVLRALAAWGSAHMERSTLRRAKGSPGRGAGTGRGARSSGLSEAFRSYRAGPPNFLCVASCILSSYRQASREGTAIS
jgi:HxlR-like helix-turn-helix